MYYTGYLDLVVHLNSFEEFSLTEPHIVRMTARVFDFNQSFQYDVFSTQKKLSLGPGGRGDICAKENRACGARYDERKSTQEIQPSPHKFSHPCICRTPFDCVVEYKMNQKPRQQIPIW